MASATTTERQTTVPRSLFGGKRGRILRENLVAYLFLLPAGLIIFLFGIFPVGFAFFVSLHRWRLLNEGYVALGNYQRALGDVAFVLFFWFGVGALAAAGVYLWRGGRSLLSTRTPGAALLLLPALLNAAAGVLFVRWFFLLLPTVLDVPNRLLQLRQTQSLQVTSEIFVREMLASFSVSAVLEAGNLMLVTLLAALAATVLLPRLINLPERGKRLYQLSLAGLFAVTGVLLLQLTFAEIDRAISTALAAGTELPVWSQVIMISAGAALLAAAYLVWTRAVRAYGNRRFWLISFSAVLLAVGGYVLVVQLPAALNSADARLTNGFYVTLLFVIGTVPVQLAAGLGIAYLLFQNIRGKVFFRMLYFLPYIMPFAATSVVFRLLFSPRPASFANQVFGALGGAPQNWLQNPNPVGQLMFGQDFPTWLAGPSLALLVIMIYTTWTYIGYDAVVFLAGLGNIPAELYEAARIDGASGWRVFRHITLPLLSPTTFFLSLIAIIGTFQAFTQIFIMRDPGAGRSIEVISLYIYTSITTDSNYGYGSAMAFVLFGVILVLTIAQNRIAGRRVFYG